MMTWLVNIAYLAAAVLYFPVLVYQWTVQKKNRRGWRQRFGRIHLPQAAGPRAWIHAVSLGEVNCTPVLVRKLTAARPDLDVVVSTTTDTGYARACQLYPPGRVFRYPLDFSWIVRRAWDRIRPDLIVLVELEVWPNLVSMAQQRGVPVAVINGRLTERSARRLSRVGTITQPMFSGLSWVAAQDETIAARFRAVGAPADRVSVAGSLKWDTAEVLDEIPGAKALAGALGISRDRPLWVCGSTGPSEEVIILDAYQCLMANCDTGVTLVIVPRKPERFDEVAALIRARGLHCLRRSEHRDGATPEETRATVILGDTMGELRKFYSLATVVFVGRSLVPMGGSDPMEVAAMAKPILAGPYMNNFEAPASSLSAAGALTVVRSHAELAAVLRGFLHERERSEALGRAARAVVLNHQGASQVTVEGLLCLLTRRLR